MDLKVQPDELFVFQKFKDVVCDLDEDDSVLLRFLRARDCDVDNAEKMLRNAVKWRQHIGMDNFLEWEFPSNFPSDLNWRYFGTTNDGAGICWMIAGRSNLKAILERGEYDYALRWAYVMMETGHNMLLEGRVPGLAVIDMEDLTYTQATHIRSLRILYDGLQQFEKSYPEMVKKMMVINAPWVFTFVWNFVKGAFSQRTRDKITIYNSSNKAQWFSDISSMVPRESIPPEYQLDIYTHDNNNCS